MEDFIKVKIAIDPKKKSIWTTEDFVVDNNLKIKIGIFRTNGKDEKNVNHIFFVELYWSNKLLLRISRKNRNQIENLDSIIIKEIEKMNIDLNTRKVYLLIINSIILKVLLTEFKSSETKKDIDIKFIKDCFLSNTIQLKWLQNIFKNPKLLSLISQDKIDISYFHNNVNCILFNKMIKEYTQNLNNPNFKEEQWQKFFTENKMILSFLSPIPIVYKNGKANVAGTKIDNSDSKLVDFVYKNKLTNNSCIIEIKTPYTKLFNDTEYRKGICNMSNELIGGINQLIRYKDSFTKEYNSLIAKEGQNRDFECWNVKTILIIGNTKEFANCDERINQFELFRNSMNDIIVITFDELFEKLKSIFDIITPK